MATQKTKKLPKGVGKRIVESLKNQDVEQEAGAEFEEKDIVEELEYPEIEESAEIEEEVAEEPEEDALECVAVKEQEDSDEDSYECAPKSKSRKKRQEEPQSEQQYYDKYEGKYEDKYEYLEEKPAQEPAISDIDTLLDLISRLPSGVTKQTGALIIRQTMEAMGMPMNKVLANAQSSQEELENNIRNNVNVIEEYRTNIKILEQEIQKFRRKAHDLEDIISLFILSEEKR